MSNDLKALLENHILSDKVKEELTEAWEKKVQEVKEQVTAEVRDEFAAKYDVDKATIIEAIDAKVNEVLKEHVNELDTKKKAAFAEQIKYKKKSVEDIKALSETLHSVLESEMKEFHEERKAVAENMGKISEFIVKKVTEILEEYAQEKRKISEDRVKFKVESKKQLDELKKKLVDDMSTMGSDFLVRVVNEEFAQLKEDLKEAKRNNFGRKIYETFAAEYAATFINESREAKKLLKAIEERDAKLAEAKKQIDIKQKELAESVNKIKKVEDSLVRANVLNELLAPLGEEKRAIMNELLEQVPTKKLNEHFNRYLPTLLEGIDGKKRVNTINESINEKNLREVTGDRPLLEDDQNENESNETINQFVDSYRKLSKMK